MRFPSNFSLSGPAVFPIHTLQAQCRSVAKTKDIAHNSLSLSKPEMTENDMTDTVCARYNFLKNKCTMKIQTTDVFSQVKGQTHT